MTVNVTAAYLRRAEVGRRAVAAADHLLKARVYADAADQLNATDGNLDLTVLYLAAAAAHAAVASADTTGR